MFEISFGEILLIGVVALVVLGPERLPTVARTLGALVGRAQRFVATVKADIQQQANLTGGTSCVRISRTRRTRSKARSTPKCGACARRWSRTAPNCVRWRTRRARRWRKRLTPSMAVCSRICWTRRRSRPRPRRPGREPTGSVRRYPAGQARRFRGGAAGRAAGGALSPPGRPGGQPRQPDSIGNPRE